MIKWIIIIIIILLTIRVYKRGFFWEARDGRELSFREFLSSWKDGISGISPLQQSKMQLMGIWITITGITAGIIVNALIRMENIWWWVEIILVGSLIVTGVSMLGIYQKYIVQKKVEAVMKKLNEENKK